MYIQTQVARAVQRHRYEASLDRHHEQRPRGVRLFWILRRESRRWEFAPVTPNSPRRYPAFSLE